jgi:hypothetical protein
MSKLDTTIAEGVPPDEFLDLNAGYCCRLYEVPKNSSSERLPVTELCEIITPWDIVEPLPSAFVLHGSSYANAVSEGDSVQVVMRWNSAKPFDLSRWIKVTSANGELLEGMLEPSLIKPEWFEAPNLDEGTVFRLKRSHVFRVRFANPEKQAGLEPVRQFWDRGCQVEESVLKESAPVRFLYREVSNLILEDDDLPDSGWRIRSTTGVCEASYVPLGAVLDHDDSWRYLVDVPLGAVFAKDPETGFIRQLREGTRLGSFLFLQPKFQAPEAEAH